MDLVFADVSCHKHYVMTLMRAAKEVGHLFNINPRDPVVIRLPVKQNKGDIFTSRSMVVRGGGVGGGGGVRLQVGYAHSA